VFGYKNNSLLVKQVSSYYPFGMNIKGLSTLTPGLSEESIYTPNEYLYNGKMFQDELGLDWLDYGARMYDAVLGRWHGVDPLAERRIEWTTYAYCLNNPILRLDPNGLTDYTFNKRTGQVKQVGEKNDEPDRILKSNRKGVKYDKNGEAKVAIDGIEKGILKDGQNFKTDDQLISVGGEGQPTEKGVEVFALKISVYVGKEISGSYFSKDGSSVTTHMTIGQYKSNNLLQSKGFGHLKGIREGLKLNELTGFFHTHPNLDDKRYNRTNASPSDKLSRDNSLSVMPHLKFFIITAPLNYGEENLKIDYTNH